MKWLLVVAMASLCTSVSAHAQSTGDASGSIYDQTGAALPGVRLTIRGVTERATQTGAAGEFAFPSLPEGDYEITAELSGFERVRRPVHVQ
jgi:hypothetical protein